MEFHQHKPTGHLADHIVSMDYFSGYTPEGHSIQRVVPTGTTFLIFELDGYQRHTYDNETLEPNADYKNAWYSGQHRNYISISAHQDSSMFVIQFSASGAYPFLHQPMETFTEKVKQAEDIFGDSTVQLRNSILAAATPEEKFKTAEQWLNEHFDNKFVADDELTKVVTDLQKGPAANLNSIIDNYPHTQKHLIDTFKKHIGHTPKYYQRILRFNDILGRIHSKETIKWSDIAYTCGFSDQSHFIKEFKHFSGFNPEEFIDLSHNKQSNFFPLDKQ